MNELKIVIKQMFCHHIWRHCAYLHGDSINVHNGKRHEYICIKCGKYNWLDYALNCVNCKHFWYDNSGSGNCDLGDEKICVKTNRSRWEEIA